MTKTVSIACTISNATSNSWGYTGSPLTVTLTNNIEAIVQTLNNKISKYNRAVSYASRATRRGELRGYNYKRIEEKIAITGWLDNTVSDSGTASAGGNTTLTDATNGKAWDTNEWANYEVWITGGTGVGGVRKIISNTATALTVDSAWTVNPADASTYTIGETAIYKKNKLIAMSQSGEFCTLVWRTETFDGTRRETPTSGTPERPSIIIETCKFDDSESRDPALVKEGEAIIKYTMDLSLCFRRN